MIMCCFLDFREGYSMSRVLQSWVSIYTNCCAMEVARSFIQIVIVTCNEDTVW